MAKEELPSINEETIEMIEGQVKKGKARKFFLIYKGASIKTLVVFKKGPFGPKVLAAKKSGFKGEVCYGVVIGSGKNLDFQIAGNGEVAAAMKVDSFEEQPPMKKAKLREFLSDAGLAFKPDFTVVTQIGDVQDPETEDSEPSTTLPTNESGVEDDETRDVPKPPPPPPPESKGQDPAAVFKERFGVLLPLIKAAAGTPAGQNAKLKASEAGVFARKQDFDQANAALDEVENLLQNGQGDSDHQASDFKERLAGLLPKLKSLAGTPAGDEAKLKASEAGMLARKQAFQEALTLLDEVESLISGESSQGSITAAAISKRLKGLMPQMKAIAGTEVGNEVKRLANETLACARNNELERATQHLEQIEQRLSESVGAGEPSNDLESQWSRKWEAIEPQYVQAAKRPPGKYVDDLAKVKNFAVGKASEGSFDSAIKALAALQRLIDSPPEDEESIVPAGLVEYRKALLAFDAAMKSVAGQIQKLQSTIGDDLPDESELAESIAERIEEMNEELQDLIDLALNKANDVAEPINANIRKQITEYKQLLNTDSLVAHLDNNPFVALSIGNTLTSALSKIEKAMPAAA